MSDERRVLDVSGLPSVHFGPKSLLWWGTIGFIIVEGFTVALMAASYLYLRLNEYGWPPGRTPNPDLLIPTINTVVILAVIVPMIWVDKAARRFDRGGVLKGLTIAAALSLVATVLRWFDLTALNVKWDAHAYGSAAWGVVVLHATLILLDLVETLVMIWLFVTHRTQLKHYSDASDAALYQYFLSLAWVPLYVLIYWGPRFL